MATTTRFPSTRADPLESGLLPAAGPPSPFAAVLRHPFLTLLPIVMLVGGAVAFGLVREPRWTSEARLTVGELSPSTQSAPGIVEANQQLASAYSRAVTADKVLTRVSRELGIAKAEIKRRLTASPIPESPVVTVSGTGPTERDAIAITQVGTSALIRYIRDLGDTNREAERLLNELTAARREVLALEQQGVIGPNPEIDAAKLRADSIRMQYLETTRRAGSTPITELNPAEAAANDREKILRLAIVMGCLAGIAIGAALATARETRLRRRLAPPV